MPTEHDAPNRDVRVANAHYDGESAAADFERDHGPLDPPRRIGIPAMAARLADALGIRPRGQAA